MTRIYPSPPDLVGTELSALERAVAGGWVAPLGPEVDAFEVELAVATDRAHAVALSAGTAGIHLALERAGVGPGSRVLAPSLTFVASVNPVRYLGGEVVLVDSDATTWSIDPDLVAEAFDRADIEGRPYAALLTVDLYGQCVDYSTIVPLCERYGVTLIEDAAEALGSTHAGRRAGSFGHSAALSFNGNKVITTSGGGAIVTDDGDAADRARFLATQARDPAPHYEHTVMGYNYRMSNLLAAFGRSQLADLGRRVERRRRHNAFYREMLAELPGVRFMEEGPGNRTMFWLTTLTVDPTTAGVDRETIRLHLESLDIESRPVWKPMHLQPLYGDAEVIGGAVSARLFEHGLCLPSGSNLTDGERTRIAEEIRSLF